MSDGLAIVPGEPSRERCGNPVARYFMATRPAFLSVTLLGVLLGLACARQAGVPLDAAGAAVTLLFALVAHAAANVINDYHDAEGDAGNSERLFPFTGGSRFIQNHVLSRAAIGRFGYALLLSVIPAGLWLVQRSGSGLLAIGLAGMLVGWSYSAPPLTLAARGLGEAAVAAGWGLVVVGGDFVQRGAFAPAPLLAGLGYGLMVANLLYINQFPDAAADARAGKMTLVARLGRRRAVAGYAAIALGAAAVLLLGVVRGLLPPFALAALAALLPAGAAYRRLRAEAERPAKLRPAILATLAAAHLFGLLLAAACVFG